jgi:hypothetical protein
MKRRTRWAVIGMVGALFLPLTVALVWRAAFGSAAREHLRQVQADLDATDPGWRLEDLLAAREKSFPPDDRNPALVTEAVEKLLPKEYVRSHMGSSDWLPKNEPNRLPRSEDAAAAARDRARCGAAIEQARRLRHMPQSGGARLVITPDVVGTLLPHIQYARAAAAVLAFDAVMAAYDRDPDWAVASIHAGVYAGRSFGDEPFSVSMIVRMACSTIARNGMERVLGLSEPGAGLADVQVAFAEEAEAPLLTIGFRGQRACHNRYFENIESGAYNLTANGLAPTDPLERLQLWWYNTRLPADHACMLEKLTRFIEISRLPAHEQLARYALLQIPDDKFDPKFLMTGLLLPSLEKFARSDVRTKAILRTAVAGIACERFRREKGRWPTGLAEVPKAILPEVPLDPYDGRPLRFRRVADGVVVYSVGPDGTDDDGNLTREYKEEPGEDYGFRLYDPAHRRAAPLPKPEPETR